MKKINIYIILKHQQHLHHISVSMTTGSEPSDFERLIAAAGRSERNIVSERVIRLPKISTGNLAASVWKLVLCVFIIFYITF